MLISEIVDALRITFLGNPVEIVKLKRIAHVAHTHTHTHTISNYFTTASKRVVKGRCGAVGGSVWAVGGPPGRGRQ